MTERDSVYGVLVVAGDDKIPSGLEGFTEYQGNKIIVTHILPNAIGPIIVLMTLNVANNILLESSFLKNNVPPLCFLVVVFSATLPSPSPTSRTVSPQVESGVSYSLGSCPDIPSTGIQKFLALQAMELLS